MQGRTSVDPGWKSVHEDGSDFPGETHPAMVALQTGKPVKNVIMGVYNPAGDEEKWININAMPQFKPGESQPYQVYATFEDLTARFKAERKLQIAKNRLDLAFAAAGMGWWDWDLPTQTIAIGPNTARMLGYQREEMVLNVAEWNVLIHPEDRDKVSESMNSHLDNRSNGYEAIYRLKTKDGSYRWAHDRGRIVERDDEKKPKRLIGTVQETDPDRCMD